MRARALQDDELPGPVGTRERAVGSREGVVVLLQGAVREGEARGRVVVVGKVALGGLEHRDSPLGLAQLEIGRDAMRVERGARLGGPPLRGLAFEIRRPLLEDLRLSGRVVRGFALLGEGLIETRDVVGGEARAPPVEDLFRVSREVRDERGPRGKVLVELECAVEP